MRPIGVGGWVVVVVGGHPPAVVKGNEDTQLIGLLGAYPPGSRRAPARQVAQVSLRLRAKMLR